MATSLRKSYKLEKDSQHVDLPVKGQGVFLFTYTDVETPCSFTFYSKNKESSLRVELSLGAVVVTKEKDILFDPKNTKGLTKEARAYYWFSLDAQNLRLSCGIGEARCETATYTYQFPSDAAAAATTTKSFLESLTYIEIPESITPLYVITDPVKLTPIPLEVKDIHKLTMSDIASGKYMPKPNLSLVAQKLYDCITGENFVLDDDDFPDFSKAIEYSIATPGLWCHETLKKKANEFSKEKPDFNETYLRITLGDNNGESPGIPYVMEIWPPAHYSPIHSHSAANAVIRVLHGKINVKLFPFLCDTPFGERQFEKDMVTWISPTLNQNHQLHNLPENSETCITIQCYMYDGDDKVHYDYFDYLDADGNKEQYEPDSDMDFLSFKRQMKEEWDARTAQTKKPKRSSMASLLKKIKKLTK